MKKILINYLNNKMARIKKEEVAETGDGVETTLSVKKYVVPETKEEYLNLIQCLKDTGCTDVSGLEVRASRL